MKTSGDASAYSCVGRGTLIQKASGGKEISQVEEGGAESLRKGARASKGRNEIV